VYKYQARSRALYLPQGADWYDFYSGEKLSGGQHIQAAAPLDKMPLYVKAGSIVPTGEDIQFVNDKPDAPITLNIYTGANGHYSLYNDDGRSYDYEQGKYSTIELRYDDATGKLTIGKRQGEFNGMQPKTKLQIRWIGAADGMAKSQTGPIVQTIEYGGDELVVTR
jgi:alpha-D-xyloside xylohydrolase